MNELDIVFLVLGAVFTLRGLLRGAIREAMCLVAFIVGLWAALAFNSRLAPLLEGLISAPGGQRAVAFVAIFAAVALLGWFLARHLHKRLGSGKLGWLDYILGGAIGLAEGALLCAAVMVLLTSFFSGFDFVRTSVFRPYLLDGAAVVSDCLPDSARERARECGILLPEARSDLGRTLENGMDAVRDALAENSTEPADESVPAESGQEP